MIFIVPYNQFIKIIHQNEMFLIVIKNYLNEQD